MTRIKIEDFPRDQKISRDELRKVLGGYNLWEYSILPKIYSLNCETGVVSFGNGEPGLRPTSGETVKASYRD